ncbi:MAG TPA: metalloregulator ArsR/SmtB family transcription factor [Gemmatimonas sp.]|nr:metalloregulator ArsR/SmtB family transcription factor [Gemmatimonas sp.]
MATMRLTPQQVSLVAERFRALAEPARLNLLIALRDGERSVGELVEDTGLATANVSKHLQQLHGAGYVTRRKEGLYVLYALAGKHVMKLCDLMCSQLEAEAEAQRKLFASR